MRVIRPSTLCCGKAGIDEAAFRQGSLIVIRMVVADQARIGLARHQRQIMRTRHALRRDVRNPSGGADGPQPS